jgi:hypothetical protein
VLVKATMLAMLAVGLPTVGGEILFARRLAAKSANGHFRGNNLPTDTFVAEWVPTFAEVCISADLSECQQSSVWVHLFYAFVHFAKLHYYCIFSSCFILAGSTLWEVGKCKMLAMVTVVVSCCCCVVAVAVFAVAVVVSNANTAVRC